MKLTAEERKNLMLDAWSIYHALVGEYPDAASRVSFSQALKAAWERQPRRYATKIRKEWESIGAAEQLTAARKMANKAISIYESKNAAFLDSNRVEIDDIAAETWALMQERLDRLELLQAKRNRENRSLLPFGALLYRSAAQAIRALLGDCLKNSGDELNSNDYEIRQAEENTERSALLLDAMNSVADSTQRTILELMIQGETVRSIAEIMRKSKTTVQRTIESIRSHLRDRIA